MNNKLTMDTRSILLNSISYGFGALFFAIGVINTFWGNDTFFGLFIIGLSLLYFPPVTALIREKTGFSIPAIIKVLLAVFIMVAALGVGELFDKIDLMRRDF